MAANLDLRPRSAAGFVDHRGNDGLTNAERDVLAAEHRAYVGNFTLAAADLAVLDAWVASGRG